MSELTNIHGRSVKDLTTPSNLPADPDALDQVKLVAGNFPAEYAGSEALTLGMVKEITAHGREAELEEVFQKITQEETRAKAVENLLSQNKAEKTYVDSKLEDQNIKVNNHLSNQTQTVNTALSQLSTAATKFYPTLAEANADIANVEVNQPVQIGESANGGLWYKATAGATSLTKSPHDPLTQAKSYSESQRKLGENNVTQMWFVDPYYERNGSTLYIKPGLFTTTDNCFYVRDKRYPSDTITRTKFWSDLQAQIPAERFKVTSPLGVIDCIAITGLEALLYDHVNKKIVLGSRDTAGDYTVLVANNNAEISPCVEEHKILDQITERKLNTSIASTTNGRNNVTQMWFIKPYYEWSGNTLYFKPSTLGDNCFYVRDKRYPNDTITRTKFWDDLSTQITPTRFKVTSPLGVTDCIALTALEALLYDHVNKKIVLGARDTVGDYTVLIAVNGTQIGACLEEHKILDQINKQELQKDTITIAKVKEVARQGENNVTQMWFIDPYYEWSANILYVKPGLFSTTDNCFYVRDKRYPNDTITRTKFWDDLSTQVDPTRFKVTSPSGVTDCIALKALDALLYDHVNKKIVLGARDTVGDYTCLIAHNITEVGACLEEHKIRDQILMSQLRNEMPVVSDHRQVSSTYKVKGVAHRGYSTEAPENTLPAYILAKTKGFEYVECDIGFTSDDVPVLLHDETIDRTSTGTGTLSEMTLDQVKAFDYGSWKNAKYAGTQIPTLEEFLKLCRNLGLHPYLEIKNVPSATQARVESVVAMVNTLGMKGKVSYISFNVNILRWIKAVDGTARLGLVGGTGESSSNLALTLKTSANDVFVDGGYTDVTESRVLYAISKNLGFEVWTVNNPALIRGLADMGISGITTDSLDIDAIIKESYV